MINKVWPTLLEKEVLLRDAAVTALLKRKSWRPLPLLLLPSLLLFLPIISDNSNEQTLGIIELERQDGYLSTFFPNSGTM